MTPPKKPQNDRPDPIEESLRLADEEHDDAPTNRRWFWRFLLPFVVFFLLSMVYVFWHLLRGR